MDWKTEEKAAERGFLEDFASYKYDEYQQFAPGRRFLESLALWLRQFRLPEERRTAYEFVKKRLVFISDTEMNHLVELAYPTFIRPHLMTQTATATGIEPYRAKTITTCAEYRRRLRQTLVLGMSDGARTDRFRRANPLTISNEQIWHAYDVSSAKAEDLRKKLERDLAIIDNDENETTKTEAFFSTVVLLDDFTASSASIFDHGIEMMQLDPFRQFGPFFFTQTDHIELLHNHPSQLWPQLTGRQLIMPVYDVE